MRRGLLLLVIAGCGRIGFDAGGDGGALPAGRWQSVAVGKIATRALTRTDELWCWGSNGDGQAGIDPGETTPRPTKVGDGWKRVALGTYHGCGIKKDGSLWCWGWNLSGAVGAGAPSAVLAPTMIDAGPWEQVSLGGELSCAIRAPTTIPIANVVAVAAGGSTTCVIDADARLYCAGANSYGQTGPQYGEAHELVQIDQRSDWVDIVASRRHACARTEGGETWCWGHGDQGQLGQLGDPALVQRNAPRRVSNANEWRAVAAGDHFTCTIKKNGTRWCGGANEDGQLGNGRSWHATFSVVP